MDSASSQFFIVHKDSLFLNKKYAAFGYVVDGIDVVDKVCTEAEPTDDNGTIPAKSQPIINSVKIYSVDEFKSFTNTTQKEESSSLDESNNSDESTTSDDSSNNTESSDTISNWVTSVEATDYAVIDIKDYGKISVALDSKTAPITVENFKKLANSGFYDGLTFHRIMEGFMMQGGDPEGNGTGGSDEKIKGEFLENGISNNISHVRGAISMARAGYSYDSATSQFFIVHENSQFLDKKYAAFGYVVDGIDVVDKICTEAEPIDNNGTIPADNQPIINSIKIYSVDEFKSFINNTPNEDISITA
jgi:peptidyl-prolyl cis-trans isomerase B (cyclophilin B)